jgi:predicted Zn-dependent peptidase
MKDLNNSKLEDAKNFYEKYYAPNNAVLVIAGDIDYTKTKELVQKYFGELKPSDLKKKKFPDITFQSGEVTDTIYDKVQLPAVYIGYKIPGLLSKEDYSIKLLSSILSDGNSSILYKDLVYKSHLAKSVYSFVWNLELGGLFLISATGFQNSKLTDIEENIDKQIKNILSGSVTEQDLQKAKNKSENWFVNRQQTMLGIADLLAYYWTYFKNTDMINTDITNYNEVSLKDITYAAEKYLTKNNRVVLYYLPEKDEKTQK